MPKTHQCSIKESWARLIESFLISDKLLVVMDVTAVRATNLTCLCRKGKKKKKKDSSLSVRSHSEEQRENMSFGFKGVIGEVCSPQNHTHSDRRHRLIRDHSCHQRDKSRLKLTSSTSAKYPQINQKQAFLYGWMFIRTQ